MSTLQMTSALRYFCRAALGQDGTSLTDGQLLEGFVRRREEDAFTALVQRHGPMVFGVCQRLLHNTCDAEDAFQATFLVLVHKAASLHSQETIGNWLYGVAYRVALKARAASVKRRLKESLAMNEHDRAAVDRDGWLDLQPLLDRELNRLPDKYREPVVLCELQGKTRKDVARQLGIPEGTLSSRLATARELLAKRLRRYGLAFSAASLATAMSHGSASACVPASLAVSTVKAAMLFAAGEAAVGGAISAQAAALTKGALQTMFITKLKIATAILLTLGLLGTSTAWLTLQALADKPVKAAAKEPRIDADKKEAGKKSSIEISGVVQRVDHTQNNLVLSSKELGAETFAVARDAKVLVDDGTGDKFGFQEGKFADLSDGAQVTLRLTADREKVVGIWIEAATAQGVLKSVDLANNTIVVLVAMTKREPAVEQTFQIAPSTRISVDDSVDKIKKPATNKLSDLSAGAQVTLRLSGDKKTVGSIRAQGQVHSGTLKALDAAKNTITVGDGKNGDKTFDLAKDVTVSIDGGKGGKVPQQPGKLADLTIGAVVTLKLSLDQKMVVAVIAEGASINGVLKAVDAAKSSITVTTAVKGEPEVERTFEVAKDARITIDDKPAKGEQVNLADLPVNARVAIKLSADMKTVVAIHAAGADVSGTLKGNAGNNQLTIGNKGGDQIYNLAANVQVILDDARKGTLADLVDGTVVHARLSVDQKEITGTIRAEGPSFQGRVKGADAAQNSITLTIGGKNGEGGEEKEFKLTKGTVVATQAFGVPVKLDDIRNKDVVLQLSIDQKTARRILVVGE